MDKRWSFQQMVLEQLDIRMQKKISPDTDLTLFTRINLKWITDLNVKWKTKTPGREYRRKPR